MDVILAVVVGLPEEAEEGLECVFLPQLLHLAGVLGSREDVRDKCLPVRAVLLKLEILLQPPHLLLSALPHTLVYLIFAQPVADVGSLLIELAHCAMYYYVRVF